MVFIHQNIISLLLAKKLIISNMRLCVLLSCVNQESHEIIKDSNIQTDIIVVNQCGKDSLEEEYFINKQGNKCLLTWANSSEKGLSRSRNLAIRLAKNYDICMLSDDDEVFEDNYEGIITDFYCNNIKADVVAFSIIIGNRKMPKRNKRLGFVQIQKTCSAQLSFKTASITKSNIVFDEMMGSGTGNGGSEEVKFLMDCYRKRLNMFYCKELVTTVKESDSLWFKGYDNTYCRNIGWTCRRSLGTLLGYCYLWYYALSHYKYYKSNMSLKHVIHTLHQGFNDKR